MRAGVLVILVFAAAFLFPPWRPVATWQASETGQAAPAAAQDQLNRYWFGYRPYAYSWFWRAPRYESSSPGGITSLERAPSSYAAYRFSSSEVSTRIDITVLLFSSSLVALLAAVFMVGLARLRFDATGAFKLSVVCVAILSSAWIAYVGLRSIVFFSGGSGFVTAVPSAVTIFFIAGTLGTASSFAVLRFPRPASAVAMLSLITTAATVSHQLMKHERPLEVAIQRSITIALLIVIAGCLYALFLRPQRPLSGPAA